MNAKQLRRLIASGKPIITPTAHDALSARLVEQLGFSCFALGGSTMLAARLGLPDVGLVGLAEMLECSRDIVGAVSVPCIADADDGYGDVKNVVRTIHAYEEIGVAGLVFEDQERLAKRPGDNAANAVVDVQAMCLKIAAAVEHRRYRETLVIARTDSYSLEGLQGSLRRCEAYLRAGADGIFVPGVRSHDDLRTIGAAFPGVYKIVVQVEGSPTPWLSATELHDMGYTQIAYPTYILNRVIEAILSASSNLGPAADPDTPPPLLQDLAAIKGRFNDAVRAASWRALEDSPHQTVATNRQDYVGNAKQ